MGHLRKGTWSTEDRIPTDAKGAFVRGKTSFRHAITDDGSSPFPVETGRYHLYVSYACPWAHRTLIARAMLGLEEAISVSVSHPLAEDQGWVFSEGKADIPDPIIGADFLWQVYVKAAPDYTGRVTVPVLWDRETSSIVNNESREILRMMTTAMRGIWTREVELSPPALREQIDATIEAIYEPINNGVYRCGFARSQEAYDEAVAALFVALDHYEQVLSRSRYLCGAQPTEADICLFTTLVRFDVVYATHFKCNVRRIVDYPNLWGYLRDVYALPGVAGTCNFEHIKNHYFQSHRSVNPKGIVPAGPEIDFNAPHDRARLG